jgi:(p)ppGpp synthase/HD superfamily hydrolase
MTATDLPPTLEDAIVLAAHWHRGQIYPSLRGEPFILHPLRVMLQLESDVERIVAVLHDVIEDTACTVGDLRALGYSEQVIAAVDRLTHRDGDTYDTYVERIKDEPLARQVKLADLTDNLANNRRLAEVTADTETRERILRYEQAIEQLRAAASAATAEPPL